MCGVEAFVDVRVRCELVRQCSCPGDSALGDHIGYDQLARSRVDTNRGLPHFQARPGDKCRGWGDCRSGANGLQERAEAEGSASRYPRVGELVLMVVSMVRVMSWKDE